MPQTITLTLPDNILQPVQRAAQATQQSVKELLVTASSRVASSRRSATSYRTASCGPGILRRSRTLWRVMLNMHSRPATPAA